MEKTKADNPQCVWDFTCPESGMSLSQIKEFCKEFCKKWCFQKEQGETGYIHWQGRISLKQKSRNPPHLCNGWRWSLTSKENYDNFYYTEKNNTRIEGPWKDTDEEIYIPRQIREIKELYPWQKSVIKKLGRWDTRHINLLYDQAGNNGKSILKGWCRAYSLARPIPFCNDFRDVLRMVMDMPESKAYIIDMPRAIKKDQLFQFYSAIESIKDGYVYDDRYAFKERYFDCPEIWVFTNKIPDLDYLSLDRWYLWKIDKVNKDLEIITEEEIYLWKKEGKSVSGTS